MQEVENTQANEELAKAVIHGDIDKAIEAITSGASIHMTTPKGNNLLYVAASRHQPEMFEWLLEIEQNDKKIDLDIRNARGSTALAEMIKEQGYEFYIKKILEAGANPNIASHDYISPLIQACGDKKVDIVNILLDHNVDVNYRMPDTGNTAFLMAASQSSLTICEALKAKGADVNACDSFGKNALITALYRTEQFMKKHEKAEHKALCLYLTQVGINLDYIAPSGMSAFWAASLSKDKDAVMSMLSQGVNADVWHEIGLEGQMSAMHLWCNSKEVDIVRAVHAAGGRLGQPDANGNNPEAYGFLNPALRELMIELNADVNSIYHAKKSTPGEVGARIPVISAVINSGNKQKELVDKMIQLGAKVTFEDEDLQKVEPIIMAINASAYDVVESLLNTKQIDVNRLIKINDLSSSISVLDVVVSGSLNKSFNQFLDQKAQLKAIQQAREQNAKNGVTSTLLSEDALNQIDEDLKNIEKMEEQLQEERKKIFDMLLNCGAQVNLVNEDGHSAIFFAAKKEYAQWLSDANADLFMKDKDGNNPLIYAVMNNKKELMEFLKPQYQNHKTLEDIFYQLAFTPVETHLRQSLLEQGIRNYVAEEVSPEVWKDKDQVANIKHINYQDEDGNSPLLVASANNLPFLVSLYLKLGADINMKNNNGETPLMHAIATDNDRMVEYMIEHKADVNVVTNEGKSILDFAQEVGNKQILEKVKIALGHEITEGSISGVKKVKP